MRRTTGWIMPVDHARASCSTPSSASILPAPWTHKGYEIGRLVGHMYMTLEGIFGVAVDVSSSLIILFTIYGAFLQFSGAGKFFIDFSFSAMGGKPTGAGRTVVLASFLLGGPSGSGVATTVTLGSVAYPMLAKVGLRQGRGGRPARRGRPGRDHLAAGARRGGVPHRRVPQDLVPRRAADGDDPDLPVLPRAVLHGRDRRAQVRHERTCASSSVESAVEPDQEVLVPFPVAGLDRRLHAARLSRRCCRCSGRPWSSCVTSFLHRDCALFSYDLFRGQEPALEGICRIRASSRRWRRLDRRAQRRHYLRRRRASSSAW